MRTFYVNPQTYDLELKDNNLRFTEDFTQWLAIRIESVLKTFRGGDLYQS